MGTTYTNCQVRSDMQDAVVRVLQSLLKEPAYVSPCVNGWIGVYPEGGTTDTNDLARELSGRLAVAVFDWGVYDSDVFTYSLFENGSLRDEFNSAPNYFDSMSEDVGEEDQYKIDPARVQGNPQALTPYCIPLTTRVEIQAVLHPVASAETDGDLPAPTGLMQHFPDSGFQTLSQMLGTTADALKQAVAAKMQEKYVFADYQANDLAALLGMDERLAQMSYRYIGQGELEDYPIESFRVVGNEQLSQDYKNRKLWEASPSHSSEKLRHWLQQGADPNARSSAGEPVINLWAGYCHPEYVQILLEAGADVNSVRTVSSEHGLEKGVTPLMMAAGAIRMPADRQLDTVNLLIAAGADVNAQSEIGRTPLKAAAGFMKPEDERWRRSLTPKQAEQSLQITKILRDAGAVE